MRRTTIGLTILILAGLTAAPALAQRSAAMTLIVHGIAGPPSNPTVPMDVLIDGSMCLGAFEFGEILGPFPFAGRSYGVSMGPASSAAPCSLRPVVRATVSFSAGEVASLVAFASSGSRELKLEKFAVRRPGRIAGNGVVSVHHTAMAPPLDFLLEHGFGPGDGDGDDDDDDDAPTSVYWLGSDAGPDIDENGVFAANMFNGDQVTLLVPTGEYAASVAPAGSSMRLQDSMIVEVHPNAVKFLYAIGSMAGRAMKVIEYEWPMNPQQLQTLHEQLEGDQP
jgi:hypothetical protein